MWTELGNNITVYDYWLFHCPKTDFLNLLPNKCLAIIIFQVFFYICKFRNPNTKKHVKKMSSTNCCPLCENSLFNSSSLNCLLFWFVVSYFFLSVKGKYTSSNDNGVYEVVSAVRTERISNRRFTILVFHNVTQLMQGNSSF